MPETNKANQSPKLKVNQGKVHVATYQLPVGLGDCSIHLLIKKDGTIQSGFIMDGGRNSDEIKAGDVITKGLKTISETYFPSGSKPFLRAWVVTHWDADHYEGVESLLKTNALKNYFVANPVLYAGSEAFPAGMQTLLVSSPLVLFHLYKTRLILHGHCLLNSRMN
jgi:glyoxylase-like metal-dependent hydrolase (beta-lactamase superfamily II)